MCQRLLGWGWCQEWPELPESSPRQLPAPLQVSQCGVERGTLAQRVSGVDSCKSHSCSSCAPHWALRWLRGTFEN